MKNSLYIKEHLVFYSNIYAEKIENLSHHVIKEAFISHDLVIFQKLSDSLSEVVMLSSKLKNKDAAYFLRYGVGRRLEMLLHAYRTIRQIIPFDKRVPLQSKESCDLTRDINVVYINLRGILDCLAWTLLFELNSEMGARLKSSPMSVDLLLKEPTASVVPESYKKLILEHKEWYLDLKSRRDPVAHRIPLYVPPSILTSSESDEHKKLSKDASENIIHGKFDEAEKAFYDQEQIGQFYPLFGHHPDDGFYSIYPTIPEDIGHTLELARLCSEVLN